MIRERNFAGLAAARAEGRIGGRRKKLDPVSAKRLLKASSPAESLVLKWRVSTISVRPPCHGSSPIHLDCRAAAGANAPVGGAMWELRQCVAVGRFELGLRQAHGATGP